MRVARTSRKPPVPSLECRRHLSFHFSDPFRARRAAEFLRLLQLRSPRFEPSIFVNGPIDTNRAITSNNAITSDGRRPTKLIPEMFVSTTQLFVCVHLLSLFLLSILCLSFNPCIYLALLFPPPCSPCYLDDTLIKSPVSNNLVSPSPNTKRGVLLDR